MRNIYLTLLFLGFVGSAQTGIGTTTPHSSAKLEVSATNKGFLPPRVTLTSATDATTIASPADGLLVYNVGSVGLQAGYYFWNGTNWATIATASSAGNGVTSMNMVKLYGEAHSKASGKIGNTTTGYVFTVPVSGRYLFDFTSAATAIGGGSNTIFFTVRQGTTVLASDTQSSYNNNVHVEYNGKLEVNLQAGVSYNVYNYATSGSFETNDYDRVYYKMVAGNLPVTGQSVDYVQASLSANQSVSSAGNINFNVSSGTGITLSGGGFNLQANKTYKLEAAIGGTSGGYAYYGWVDAANTLLSGGSIGVVMKAGTTYTDAPQDKAIVYFTPTTNTTVYLRVLNVSGGVVAYAPPVGNNYSSTWANISQIGSSAFVNPWILSGNNVYNTTGNVGLGTTTPSTSLHIQNGNAAGVGSPASTLAPSIYVLNSNNASSTANSTVSVRTAGTGSGKPFYSLDVSGAFGYSMGINNPTDQMIINTSWDFNTTAANNAIIINRTGQTRVGIPSSGGSINDSWPSGWGGGLATYDLSCAGIYYQSLTARSDRRLKNNIVDLDSTSIANYLQLRPVNYYWNDGADNHHKQYGFIAQEVEPLFPDMVSTANDAMQTKSINYQALHAISLKVIQSQEAEIEGLKKNQAAIEARLLQLEAKLK
jgi:hypothetical protein